jgi:hypothetical protein
MVVAAQVAHSRCRGRAGWQIGPVSCGRADPETATLALCEHASAVP